MYPPETADTICQAIMNGRSLRSICAEPGMPDKATVFRWLAEDEGFATKYARARLIQAEGLADELIEIADDGRNDTYTDDDGNERTNHDVVARAKLRVMTRQWVASKLLPKKYGERTVLAGDPENPVHINSTRTLTTAELMSIAAQGAPAK